MTRTDALRQAAEQLKKSERGRAALANMQRLFIDGARGLDPWNKEALFDLFFAMMHNPWDWPAELTAADCRPVDNATVQKFLNAP